MNEIETKTLGNCHGKVDNFAVYESNDVGLYAIYSVFKEEDKEFAVFRGYLAHPENWEVVVEDLKYEDKFAMHEMEKEFGVYWS
jgi:hypothetical protein